MVTKFKLSEDVAFGERLRKLRLARRMSQAELGRRSGIRGAYISRLEGGYHSVGADHAASLAEALGVTADALFPDVAKPEGLRVDGGGVDLRAAAMHAFTGLLANGTDRQIRLLTQFMDLL